MRAILCVFALALAGCLEGGTERPGGEPPEAPALELRIEPESATVDGVQTWTLRLLVREATNVTHRGCPPELLDAWVEVNGERVMLYTYGEEGMAGACALREIRLEPGEITREVHWNARLDPAAPEPHEGAEAPPGTYPVHAKLAVVDREVRADASVTVS